MMKYYFIKGFQLMKFKEFFLNFFNKNVFSRFLFYFLTAILLLLIFNLQVKADNSDYFINLTVGLENTYLKYSYPVSYSSTLNLNQYYIFDIKTGLKIFSKDFFTVIGGGYDPFNCIYPYYLTFGISSIPEKNGKPLFYRFEGFYEIKVNTNFSSFLFYLNFNSSIDLYPLVFLSFKFRVPFYVQRLFISQANYPQSNFSEEFYLDLLSGIYIYYQNLLYFRIQLDNIKDFSSSNNYTLKYKYNYIVGLRYYPTFLNFGYNIFLAYESAAHGSVINFTIISINLIFRLNMDIILFDIYGKYNLIYFYDSNSFTLSTSAPFEIYIKAIIVF